MDQKALAAVSLGCLSGESGYPVRVMLMPIIPIPDWQRHYDELLEQLLTQVKLDRLTLGSICAAMGRP